MWSNIGILSHIAEFTNISSLCDVGTKVNERKLFQEMKNNYKNEKDNCVQESQMQEKQINSYNQNENFFKVEITCDGFFIFIFYP